MGLPVQTLGQDLRGGAFEFPLAAGAQESAADLRDDTPGTHLDARRIDAAGRDQRFAEMAERQARFMFRVAHGLLRSEGMSYRVTYGEAEDAVGGS